MIAESDGSSPEFSAAARDKSHRDLGMGLAHSACKGGFGRTKHSEPLLSAP
jgi:hypothetical protein